MRPSLAILLGVAAPFVWMGGCSKCQKDEPPPPLPTPAEPDVASQPEVLVLDAGPDVQEDADAEAGKPKGTGQPASSLKRCCDAIQQNAANAPEPTATYMKQLAASCYAAVKSGQAPAAIQGIARQAGVACK